MKRIIGMILAAMLLSFPCYAAEEQAAQQVIVNDRSVGEQRDGLIPLRGTLEALGSVVYYLPRTNSILALTRDGDTIQHVLGSNAITKNGTTTEFSEHSENQNGTAMIPLSMVQHCYEIFLQQSEGGTLSIEKNMTSHPAHLVIRDVLQLSMEPYFLPTRFDRYRAYRTQHPDEAVKNCIIRVNIGLDTPFYTGIKETARPDSLQTLVNPYLRLPEQFEAKDLVWAAPETTVQDGKEYRMNREAYEAFVAMRQAAAAEGISLKMISAYRTQNYQQMLYQNYVLQNGLAYAAKYSARPGHSEHQTGLAVDVNSVENYFADTPAFTWMQRNAHRYGFILRYPLGKEWITGYAYEPWHYRYVGQGIATNIKEWDLTYEEYYVTYLQRSAYQINPEGTRKNVMGLMEP